MIIQRFGMVEIKNGVADSANLFTQLGQDEIQDTPSGAERAREITQG